MRLTIIDKDTFANLFRYGEVRIPDFVSAEIKNNDERNTLSSILGNVTPIEYPAQYIIVKYHPHASDCMLRLQDIDSLIATNEDGYKKFTSWFREDLIIHPAKYSDVFQEYLNVTFAKEQIHKGIIAFRTICGLTAGDDYDSEVELIFHGIENRLKYHHHYQLPPEEREEPYSLMVTYDRHAPYPNSWAGYFCDVIETYCYHELKDLGYQDAAAESTSVYKDIITLGPKATSKEIADKICESPFAKRCNVFFNRPGGYLAPYIFYILRDRIRGNDAIHKHLNIIKNIQEVFPEALDTASTFIGGFFGYNKFYDEYYTSMNLPFIKKKVTLPDPPIEKKEQGSNGPIGGLFGEDRRYYISETFNKIYKAKEATALLKKIKDIDKVHEVLTNPESTIKEFKELFGKGIRKPKFDELKKIYLESIKK